MDYQIKGKVIAAMEPRSGTNANGEWHMQDFVIESNENEKYPKKIVLTVYNNRVKLEMGKEYIVHFDINSREYNGRWYNSVTAFSAQEVVDNTQPQTTAPQPTQQQAMQAMYGAPKQQEPYVETKDDLPF